MRLILALLSCCVVLHHQSSAGVRISGLSDLKETCAAQHDNVPFAFDARAVTRSFNACYTATVVRDASNVCFVVCTPSETPCPGKIGDLLRIEGKTVRNDPYGTVAETTAITVLAHGDPPMPSDRSISQLLDSESDYQYIRVKGTVLEAFRDEIDDSNYFIILADGTTMVTATINSTEDINRAIKSLVGATVSATGFINPSSGSIRLKQPRLIQIADINRIQTISPAPADPFSVSIRKRLSGRVIASWHKARILLRLPSGMVSRADLTDPAVPRYGDIVEAAGAPATDLYHDNLTRAIWRPTIADIPPESPPVDTTPQHILSVGNDGTRGINPTFHGRAIRLTGTVRGRPSSDGHLTLACGDHLVPVDATALDQAFSDVLDGSRVSISGTCVMEIPNWHADEPFPHIEGITLVPRTADDIVILARPPWWTVARLFTAIGILLLAMLFVLIWNVMLRKRAELRGRELLKEQLEHVKADLKIEERSRLSVELHDSLAQNLAGVSMEIEAANLLKAEDPNAMSEHLLAAAQTLQSCRDELRNCLWDLRSQALEETDMNTAIRRTLLPHVKNTHVAVRFNIPRSELPDNVAHAILQVIRELTVNAIRHGKATSVRIAGDLTDKILMFSVSDNGCGFDPTNRPGVAQGHFGLQGIRERIQKLNGTVRIDSRIGHGTKAVVILAVAEPKGEAPQNSET